jgi:DNA invertase Pin-like site-specific DNA recombinase
VLTVVEDGSGDAWDLDGLEQITRAAAARQYDVLIGLDTSRLARDLLKHLWLKDELKRYGIQIRYAQVEFADGPDGEMHEQMLAVFDQHEKARIRRRFKLGADEKRLRGEVMGNGRIPYGLVPALNAKGRIVSYTIDDEKAAIVRRIADQVVERPLVDLCRVLNADGITAPSGGRWGPSSIKALLANPVYVGDYQFGKTKQTKNPRGARTKRTTRLTTPADITHVDVPAILTHEQRDRAQAALEHRKRHRRPLTPATDDTFTLRQRLRCGECGGIMATNRGHFRRYWCVRSATSREQQRATRCPQKGVRADVIERHAWSLLVDRLQAPELREALEARAAADDTLPRWERQLASAELEVRRLEHRIENYTDDLADLERGSVSWKRAREQRAKAEADLRIALPSLERLRRSRPEVFGAQHVETIMRQVEIIRSRLDAASRDHTAQAALIAGLGLEGTVHRAADGDPRAASFGGVVEHVVDWTARIPLEDAPDGVTVDLTGNSVHVFQGTGTPLPGALALRLA